jgi:hypothetical protein
MVLTERLVNPELDGAQLKPASVETKIPPPAVAA